MNEITDADAIKAASTFRKSEEWKEQYASKPTLEHAQRMVESASQIATEVLARWAVQLIDKQHTLISAPLLRALQFRYDDENKEWYTEICNISILLKEPISSEDTEWKCRLGKSGEEASLDWPLVTKQQLINLINGITGNAT